METMRYQETKKSSKGPIIAFFLFVIIGGALIVLALKSESEPQIIGQNKSDVQNLVDLSNEETVPTINLEDIEYEVEDKKITDQENANIKANITIPVISIGNEKLEELNNKIDDQYTQRYLSLKEQMKDAEYKYTYTVTYNKYDNTLMGKRILSLTVHQRVIDDSANKSTTDKVECFNIDLETGNMITSLDRLKRWWNNWKPKEKTLSIINKVSEYILGGSPSKKSSSSSKKPSKANYMPNVGEVSIEPINNYSTLSDSLYVPTAREMSSIAKTINSTTNPSVGAVSRSDKNTIVVDNSQELQTLIDLNQSLIGLVQKLINKDNNVYLDGKEVARGIAPYKSEFDRYDTRNPRFSY